MATFDLTKAERTRLLTAAEQAAQRAYVPYINFPVGAAILCDDGRIIQAANVQNVALGLDICAERAAIVKALSEVDACHFRAIAIWAARTPNHHVTPCGACRQVIVEFFPPESPVIFHPAVAEDTASMPPTQTTLLVSELLPGQFSPSRLTE